MHEFALPLDLNFYTQLVLTLIFLSFGLLHFTKRTAAKYFVFGGSGDSDSEKLRDFMVSDTIVCVLCGKPSTKKCSRCKSVKYCSTKCQISDWKQGHKLLCKEFKISNSAPVIKADNDFKGFLFEKKLASKIASVPQLNQIKPTLKPTDVLFPYETFVNYFNWDGTRLAPCGLINCGNSCFANVVLQCLSWTRPLVAYLLDRGHKRECRRTEWCFFCLFETHLERANQSPFPFSPMSIISQLPNIGGNLGYGRQEDAHELMRFAIDMMQSVCLDEFGGEKMVPPSAQETTLIQYIFGGLFQSQVQCTVCKNVSDQYENMMDLTVEIHGDAESLEECLDQFTAKEWLQGDNMYKCDRCNDYVKACKRLSIRSAPNILTIALKRFEGGRFGKLNKKISFPETLDLGPYMSDGGEGSDVYKLYAVIVHLDMLNASYFGHYICYVKDFCGKWYKINDSKVAKVELEEILSEQAYMLLYSRVKTRPSSLRSKEGQGEKTTDTLNTKSSQDSPFENSEVVAKDIISVSSLCNGNILHSDESSSSFSSSKDEWVGSVDSKSGSESDHESGTEHQEEKTANEKEDSIVVDCPCSDITISSQSGAATDSVVPILEEPKLVEKEDSIVVDCACSDITISSQSTATDSVVPILKEPKLVEKEDLDAKAIDSK